MRELDYDACPPEATPDDECFSRYHRWEMTFRSLRTRGFEMCTRCGLERIADNDDTVEILGRSYVRPYSPGWEHEPDEHYEHFMERYRKYGRSRER